MYDTHSKISNKSQKFRRDTFFRLKYRVVPVKLYLRLSQNGLDYRVNKHIT